MGFLFSTFQLFYFPRYQGVPNLHQGPYAPWTPPSGEIIVPKASTSQYLIGFFFNFNILALVVSEILGGSKFTLGGPVPLCTPPSGKILASTLICLMAFSISTFQLFYFPRYQGGPKFTLGGPTPPGRPLSGEIFVPKASTLQYLIVFLISTFQLQQFPRFQGGPIFTLGGPVPLCTLPSGKSIVPEASTLLCLMGFLFPTFQLFYFLRYYGVPNLHQGALRPLDAPQRRNFCTQSEYF